MKVAILGAGGLGKAAAQIIECKEEMTLVAVADAGGYACDHNGLPAAEIARVKVGGSVAELPVGQESDDSIGEIIKLGNAIDGVFLALPNLPNDFIPGVAERFIDSGFKGAFVDALKRTRAMEMMFTLTKTSVVPRVFIFRAVVRRPAFSLQRQQLAAQSFVKIENVDIWWGVGMRAGTITKPQS
jgi:hypothetical protein